MKISFTEKLQDEYQNHRFDSSDSANSKNRVRYFNLHVQAHSYGKIY